MPLESVTEAETEAATAAAAVVEAVAVVELKIHAQSRRHGRTYTSAGAL